MEQNRKGAPEAARDARGARLLAADTAWYLVALVLGTLLTAAAALQAIGATS
jgi:hypothetical protein